MQTSLVLSILLGSMILKVWFYCMRT